MKMYIAVLDQVPDHMVPVLVAHAVLGAHRIFSWPKVYDKSFIDYTNWYDNSFKKCVLKVNKKEFNKIVELDNVFLAHESTTLSGIKSCAVLCPRDEWPNVVKFAKLWTPKIET